MTTDDLDTSVPAASHHGDPRVPELKARIEELEAEVKRMQSLAHDAIEYISPYVYLDETDVDERRNAYEALVKIRDGEDR